MTKYLEDFNLSEAERFYEETSHRFKEISYGDTLDMFEEEDLHPLATISYEFTKEQRELLKAAIKKLTKKQQAILGLFMEGLTQQQIGDKLGKSQNHICKTLYGNDAVYKGKKVKYGGIFKTLCRLIKKMQAKQ